MKNEYVCKICQYEWMPKINAKPLKCPRCKRTGWDNSVTSGVIEGEKLRKKFKEVCKICGEKLTSINEKQCKYDLHAHMNIFHSKRNKGG